MTEKPKIDWKAQAERDVDFAKSTFMEDGELRTTFVVHTGTEAHMVQTEPGVSKENTFRIVAVMCIAMDAEALTMMAEAWAADARPEDKANPLRPKVRPADREDRYEAISVLTIWRDDGQIQHSTTLLKVERDDKGKAIGLESNGTYVGEGLGGGNVMRVFPSRRPTPHERREARELLDRVMTSHTITPVTIH